MQRCRRNVNREIFNLLPVKSNECHTAIVTDEDKITETTSERFSKQDDYMKKVICSCGETFTAHQSSLSHLLSSCPVSLCFRIELNCNVQQVIDSWHGDEKIAGVSWWQDYKKNGFPDVQVELKDEKVERLSALINQFIERASTETLNDQNGSSFVLMTGLKVVSH